MRTGARRRTIIIAFFLISLLTGFPDSLHASDRAIREFSLRIDNQVRTFTVVEPSSYRSHRSVPLVIILHGAGGVGQGIIRETGWDKKAEQAGFLAVFPDAMRPNPAAPPHFLFNPQVWNDGSGRGAAFLGKVDDVKFLSWMVDQLQKTYPVDRNAVYLVGFSNGASLGFKAAGELPGRFAALAAVSGPHWPPKGLPLLKKPVSTIFIAGTADPLNPYHGGMIRLPWGIFEQPPLLSTAVNWAKRNGLRQGLQPAAGMPGVTVLQGTGKSPVLFRAYFVEGLGHMWPGGEAVFPEEYIGKDPGTLNATDLIWDFFVEAQARKGMTG